MSEKKVGHLFLAQLGKKRLRPGGKEATDWLIAQGHFSKNKKVLEVACNMGTTLVEIAKRYDCHMVGVDIDPYALEKAKQHIAQAGLKKKVTVQVGNALKLPFADQTFDLVINEAMLTMMENSAKAKALAEYYRVLKPGGKLLTHDICLLNEGQTPNNELSQTIKMRVSPLPIDQWKQQFVQAGFAKVTNQTGNMTLMSPRGMLADEGLLGTVKIIRNGIKTENRQQFLTMFRYFKKQRHVLNYIVHCAWKQDKTSDAHEK